MSREDQGGAGKPRRRFELGCGHVVVMVLALALPLAFRVGHLEREKAAIETVHQLGGTVRHGQETFVTEWFQWLMPARVVSVDLAGTRASSADVAGLRPLTHLERLDLDRTVIAGGGLEALSGLTRLQTLSLEATDVGDDDARQIAGLTRLTRVNLAGTQVGNVGLEHLVALTGLKSLNIAEAKVSDAGMARLLPLTRLQRLAIDESQVTAASVPHLRALGGLKQVSVYVPRGTGRRARDLLASLAGVEVSGIRRLPKPPAAQSLPFAESRLWGGAMPWETTTGGVTETIAGLAALEPEEVERFLDILAEARSAGDWRGGGPPRSNSPPPPAVLKGEPIRSNEEFLQTLGARKEGDYDAFPRALVYARTEAARSAIPALLEFLKSRDGVLQQRAVTILSRIGLRDPKVVAAIGGMLRAYDMYERVRAVYAFNFGDWQRWYGDIMPKMHPADAKTAVSLLLEMPEDEYWEVRRGIVEALADIVREHPQEAERAIPVVLKALNDVDLSVRRSGAYALGAIAETSPERTKAIAQQLLKMLQESSGNAGWEILEALRHVAPQSVESAGVAVPALLGLLCDKSFVPTPAILGTAENRALREASALPEVLGSIVASHPQHVNEIVLTAFRIIDDEDPRIAFRASRTLISVAEGIGQRNTRLHGGGK